MPRAWGAGIEHIHVTPYYRTGEFGLDTEGPVFDFSYLEHKDVMGLTVRLQIVNLLNARHKLYRTVYEDRRNNSPIAFIERRNQLIGPIFRLSFRGTF